MNPTPASDWSRRKALFVELAPLPPAERERRLDAECAGEPALRAALLDLLVSHDTAHALIDAPIAAGSAVMFDDGTQAQTLPPAIGPYRPLRLLGSGGMGAVYLAERRDDGFEQLVALKLIHAGFTHAEARVRFLRERQILAGLRHPGIAQLYDGGLSDQGLPYFTMEWIEGESITTWCERRQLDGAARVDLFLRVLDAVAYAHRHLVVHRDIKPANLLVDRLGQPKLLDFGIAKLLDGSEDATQTSHSRPFTPAYAAPEQLFNETITTATDIYALGALLYELLSGRVPRRTVVRQGVVADAGGFERDPSRLSAAFDERAASADAQAQALALRRRRELRSGDLDQIVRRALQRRPDDRYASVDALAEDLRAWRAFRPLASRPTALRQRAMKFLRRHWRSVSVTAALAGVLIAASVISLHQARVAEREARTSNEVRRMLTELFAAADPSVAQGRAISVRELLDQSRHRVLHELGDAPAVRAQLLLDMGRIYHALGEDPIALELLDAALPAMEQDRDRARVLMTRATSLDALGRLEPARVDAGRALGLVPALDDDHVEAVLTLAEVELSLDLIDAAAGRAQRLRDALARTASSAERDRRLSTTLGFLARLREQQGQWREAEQLMRSAIGLTHLDPDHPDQGVDQVNLGIILQSLARFDEAEQALRLGIAQHTRILGADHPLTLGARQELAVVLTQLRRLDEADSEYRAIIERFDHTLGSDHPQSALARHNFATTQYARGNYAQAEDLARQALTVAERTLPPTHERVVVARMVMAASMLETGKLDAAVAILEDCLRLTRERGVRNSLPSALNTLAIGYIKQGHSREALALTAETLAVEASLPGFDPKTSYWTRVIRARAQFAAGDYELALTEQRQLLADYRRSYGNDLGPRAATLMSELAATLNVLGRDQAQARALLDEVIAIRRTKIGAQHPATREAEAQRAALDTPL